MLNQKKKTNRKYQFEPIAHSSLFPFVSYSVRSHVKQEREKMFKKSEWRRNSRRELFNSIVEAQKNFIPPQTADENDARALSLNKQIAIKTELKSTLESLKCLLDSALFKLSGREELYYENLNEIRKEELEDKKRIESLREERKAKFLARVAEESRSVLEARERQRREAESQRKRIKLEESREEEIVLFPSDRKLAACGLIPGVSGNTATQM